MHILSIPCAAMAAINAFSAAVSLIMYLKRPAGREFLAFAALCLAAASYDVFSAGIYTAVSLPGGMLWQRLQINCIPVIAATFFWFAGIVAGRSDMRAIRLFMYWVLGLQLLSLLLGPEYTLSVSRPSVKNINVFDLLYVTYFEGEIGFIYAGQILSSFILYIYALWLLISHYKATRRPMVMMVLHGNFIYLAASLNDLMVGMGVYPFIYLSEYAFFLVVMSVAYTLLDNFVGLQMAFEALNSQLEQKVLERTRENDKLHAKLMQSEKIAAIGKLGAGVAHEINNPMGVILGFSQSLVRRMKEDDPLYMPLKSIEREAVRCKKLVADLLSFSRSGNDQMELSDINEVIETTMTLISAEARTRNIEIIRRYTPELPQLSLDRSRIQQVIVNLCSNAMHAMDAAGGELTVATRLKSNEGAPEAVEISVADTGTGMSGEVKKHLFEMFFTTKEVGKGTGLGLSLCYDIIQKHGGAIDVESEEGKGSTFFITIPLPGAE